MPPPPRVLRLRRDALVTQKRPAKVCFAKQPSYELGSLAYRVITGSTASVGADIPASYPQLLHTLLPRLVVSDPGVWGLLVLRPCFHCVQQRGP